MKSMSDLSMSIIGAFWLSYLGEEMVVDLVMNIENPPDMSSVKIPFFVEIQNDHKLQAEAQAYTLPPQQIDEQDGGAHPVD